VFKHGSARHEKYRNKDCGFMGTPGYDDKGNLFVEGGSVTWRGICELPAGGNMLVARTTNVSGVGQTGVMWDGKYLTLTVVPPYNPRLTAVYRVVGNGASSKLRSVGKTLLHDDYCGGTSVTQPFIVGTRNTPANEEQGTIVVGGNNACGYRFDFWQYPRGGKLLREFPSAPRDPIGQSVSIRE
jgi:hypothetical protein